MRNGNFATPLAARPLERQEFHIDLHVMSGHLLFVTMRVDGPTPDPIRQAS